MKINIPCIIVVSLTNLILTACTSLSYVGEGTNNLISGGSVAINTNQIYRKTSPENIHIFFDRKPGRGYIEMGQLNIDADNILGIPKSETEIIHEMQEQAASVGGDAVINIRQDSGSITGTVIVYKGANNNNA